MHVPVPGGARALSRRRALQLGGLAAGALVGGPGLVAGARAAATAAAPALLPLDGALGTAPANLLRDGRFRHWHDGTTRPITTANGSHFCGLWVGRPLPPPGSTTLQTAVASKLDPQRGGLRLQVDGPGVFYLRQYVFGDLARFSGRAFTLTVDVDVESVTMLPGAPRAELRMDVYVQARYNRSATQRVLVVDTAEVHLPAGRRRVTTTFVVPVLDVGTFPRDRWQSLELAFRPILARTMAGAVLSVREAVLAEGTRAYATAPQDDVAERLALRRYYESGSAPLAAGTDRVVRFASRKWRPGTAAHLRLRDHTGAAGKVSVVGPLGLLLPGFVPTVTSTSGFRDGFTVSVPGLVLAGTAFAWTYSVF